MKKLLNKKVIAAIVTLVLAIMGSYGISVSPSTEQTLSEIAINLSENFAGDEAGVSDAEDTDTPAKSNISAD